MDVTTALSVRIRCSSIHSQVLGQGNTHDDSSLILFMVIDSHLATTSVHMPGSAGRTSMAPVDTIAGGNVHCES
ncbi:hypothetical protein L1987_33248 [Smallanthus sonchifolius]|uniref:Uncharacterized protein n=1 Tax=Smallanthus sonchifolius TaxID=185202 RepID=A0ACB9HRC3_9ASTR|nr:hypothetical protein L1987_33248 [Smallanthus sonchifolius]